MKSYYLYENGHPVGPFSIEELQAKNITFQTPIWKKNMPEWSIAGKIEELSDALSKVPPPFPAKSEQKINYDDAPSAFKSASEKTGFKIGRALGLTGLIALLLIVVAFISYNNNGSSKIVSILPTYTDPPRPKTPAELRAELLRTEQLNPSQYLAFSKKSHTTFWGERKVILETTNNATLANFKDVIVNIRFLSKTRTDLGYKQFTILEYFKAGLVVNSKIVTYAPNGTDDVFIEFVSAVPVY